MSENAYILLAFLAIASIALSSCKEMFEDKRQVRYMRPVNPRSPGFTYES